MDISIIIVSWNVKKYLVNCLRSIFQGEAGRLKYEVFVVDNNSKDETVDYLKEHFPSVIIIPNQENHGFARANNQAISRSRGRYLLLLNPDTEIIGNALANMVSFMDSKARCGLVGPMILLDKEEIQLACARYFTNIFIEVVNLLHIAHFIINIPYLKKTITPVSEWDKTQEVPAISGCCMIARREAVEDVGPLDENFFMYGEDLDWCFRMATHGWKIYYFPQERVIHHHNRSAMQAETSMQEITLQSQYYLYKKHRGVLYASAYRLIVFIISLSHWIFLKFFNPTAAGRHWVFLRWAIKGKF